MQLKVKSVAEATKVIEAEVLYFLDSKGVGNYVPLLQIFAFVSSGNDSVTLNFFNTIVGGMRSLGAIEINKADKSATITASGVALLDAQEAAHEKARKAGVKAGVQS